MSSEGTMVGSRGVGVAVVTAYRETPEDRWSDGRWEVVGVVAERGATAETTPRLMRSGGGERRYLWSGLTLELFRDDAASYYHNLMGECPSVFVVCDRTEDEGLRPSLATLSYDEAGSYMEAEEVCSVPMPPEIYRWVEGFVLEHYLPERPRKRKRDAWKKTDGGGRGRPS